MPTTKENVAVKSLEEFTEDLHKANLFGQWEFDNLLESAKDGPPGPVGIPFIWKWNTIFPKLQDALEVIKDSKTFRRAIGVGLPPGKGNMFVACSVQIVPPGDIAGAHKHTPHALRFVIDGHKDAYSVVDGEICPLETGNLVLTPSWTWHDHHNESDKNVIWLDVVDMYPNMVFNTVFYDTYGEKSQKIREKRGEYLGLRTKPVRPTWESPKKVNIPLVYKWDEVRDILYSMYDIEGNPYDGVSLEYVNPVTGGHTFSTSSIWLQMLRPGEKTKEHRHTYASLYFVFKGSGKTVVGDTVLEWNQNDIFYIPNWMRHYHENNKNEESILFHANNLPILEAAGLYREDPEISWSMKSYPAVPHKS